MSRRRSAKVLVALFVALALLATVAPAFAHEGDSPSPSSSPGSSLVPPTSFPPVVPGLPKGNRVYVRTSAVNPTEYLIIRQAIVDAGFPDVLEVAPGSLIVDTGSMSISESTSRLMSVDKVSEVAPAPAYAGSTRNEPVSYPAWWWYLPVMLLLSLLVVATNASRRPPIVVPDDAADDLAV